MPRSPEDFGLPESQEPDYSLSMGDFFAWYDKQGKFLERNQFERVLQNMIYDKINKYFPGVYGPLVQGKIYAIISEMLKNQSAADIEIKIYDHTTADMRKLSEPIGKGAYRFAFVEGAVPQIMVFRENYL